MEFASRGAGRRIAEALLIVFFLAAALALSAAHAMRGGRGLSIGPYSALAAMTPSMEPAYGPGALLVLREAPEAGLAVGDIVAFRPAEASDIVIAHRIVGIEAGPGGASYTARGDANHVSDSPVAYRQIAGKAVLAVNGAGALLTALGSPALAAGLAVAAASALALAFLIERRDWRRREASGPPRW